MADAAIVAEPDFFRRVACFINAIFLLIDMEVINASDISTHSLIRCSGIAALPQVQSADENLIGIELRGNHRSVVVNLRIVAIIALEVHQIRMLCSVWCADQSMRHRPSGTGIITHPSAYPTIRCDSRTVILITNQTSIDAIGISLGNGQSPTLYIDVTKRAIKPATHTLYERNSAVAARIKLSETSGIIEVNAIHRLWFTRFESNGFASIGKDLGEIIATINTAK